MPNNYYQGVAGKPFHLSVGVILVNEEGRIACHHFKNSARIGGEAYTLMRETVEEGETLEDTVHRGLMEEFGAKGTVITFAGSLVQHYTTIKGTLVEKTTVYFLVKLISLNQSLREKSSEESSSDIEWLEPRGLAAKMKSAAGDLNRKDLDESKIIEKLLKQNLV